MPVLLDPEDTETMALHESADFSGKRVLEIGCGDGRLTWRYADHAASVVAIDPKAEDIALAIEDCPQELRDKIEFRVARLEELSIPAEKFDLALLSWSLWWMERAGMVHALEKIQQLLQPGGTLLDLHPTNEPAAIAVRLREQIIPAGWLNESDDYVEYEWADAALQQVADSGHFALERVSTFEFVLHADSMNDLRTYLAEEWKDAIIDDVTAMRIEELLKLPVHDKEILVSEAIRIARYRRA